MHMPQSAKSLDGVPLLHREMPAPVMAKADLTHREQRRAFGEVLRRACALARLNRDEAARALQVDPGQLGRWFAGDENPQVFRFHAHPVLSVTLLEAQAEAVDEADVTMTITIRRRKVPA